MSGFHLLRPQWLLLLPVLLALTGWLARRRAAAGAWSALVDAPLLARLRLQGEAPRGRSPWPLLALGWTLAVLALAGPSWQRLQTRAWEAPSDWVLLEDLSPSMAATDVSPSRQTRARYAIDDLLAAAHGARVALVAFSGEAYTVAPLTDDVATVRLLADPLTDSLMPEHGEQLAPALEQAGRLLAAGQGRDRRIIVLADDCSDPAQALQAAARLRERGASLDVVGIGTPGGAPQPDGEGGFVRDAAGQVQLARLQSDLLHRIASAGGGRYVPLSALPALIAQLQAPAAAPLARGRALPALRVTHWLNDGVWLLPALLLLAALLARRGWL